MKIVVEVVSLLAFVGGAVAFALVVLLPAIIWEPMARLYRFQKCGTQFIADLEIKDLALPHREAYNFHLQNTSQWLFAGCILVQDGDVSIHT